VELDDNGVGTWLPLLSGGAREMIFGYLDAGSGSLLLQALIGGLAGITVAYRAMRMKMARRGAVEPEAAEGEVNPAEDTALSAES
jgi:hypothetical protein